MLPEVNLLFFLWERVVGFLKRLNGRIEAGYLTEVENDTLFTPSLWKLQVEFLGWSGVCFCYDPRRSWQLFAHVGFLHFGKFRAGEKRPHG